MDDFVESDKIVMDQVVEASAQTRLEARFLQSQIRLSSSRKKLIKQILSEPEEIFFLSSREMGDRYGVDSSTIVRTVQAMGYEKYAYFIRDLRNHFVVQITPYSAMKAATKKKSSVAGYIQQSVAQDLENLNALEKNLDPEKVVGISTRIFHARRILVVGVDYAASLAISLAYGLVRQGIDAEAPTGSKGVVQNKVRVLTKKDLLIGISFSPGLQETIDAVKRANLQGVPTIGITDSDKSPIAQFCDDYLIASIERTSFFDSYVAPVAAINAITIACAHSQSKRLLALLEKTEKEDQESGRWYQK